MVRPQPGLLTSESVTGPPGRLDQGSGHELDDCRRQWSRAPGSACLVGGCVWTLLDGRLEVINSGSLVLVNRALALGLSPWLVFVVASRSEGLSLTGAAAAAFVVCGVTLLVRRAWPAVGGLEVAAVGLFGGLTVFGALLPSGLLVEIRPYDRSLAAVGLALAAFGSLLRAPFTSQYTLEMVPPDQAESEAFNQVNRVQTAAWGVCSTIAAASFALGALVGGRLPATVFNWFVPLVGVWLCIWFSSSRWYSTFGEDAAVSPLSMPGVVEDPPRPVSTGPGRHLRALAPGQD